MNHLRKCRSYLFLFVLLVFSQVQAEKKLAQTGFQFLSVVPDARSAALAGAMTTMPAYSSALWSNPASLAEMGLKTEIMFNQNKWIADIDHYSLSGAFQPFGGRYGNFAFSFLYVDYGEIEGTILAGNDQGYLETGMIEPYAYSLGIGYALRLSDKFSVGGQVKLVDQYLGPALKTLDYYQVEQNTDLNEVSTFAFDFGTLYRAGYKSLVFGMSVRNFSPEVRYAKEGFQLPLTFNIGISMDLLDFLPEKFPAHSVMFSVDATHPRSYPEYAKAAIEYDFLNTFFLRLGYVSNRDEEDFTYGFGFKKFGLGFDYAYTPFGVFDNVQRFSIYFSF
jgi:hypothetical protein